MPERDKIERLSGHLSPREQAALQEDLQSVVRPNQNTTLRPDYVGTNRETGRPAFIETHGPEEGSPGQQRY
jgi:hypothetical protein